MAWQNVQLILILIKSEIFHPNSVPSTISKFTHQQYLKKKKKNKYEEKMCGSNTEHSFGNPTVPTTRAFTKKPTYEIKIDMFTQPNNQVEDAHHDEMLDAFQKRIVQKSLFICYADYINRVKQFNLKSTARRIGLGCCPNSMCSGYKTGPVRVYVYVSDRNGNKHGILSCPYKEAQDRPHIDKIHTGIVSSETRRRFFCALFILLIHLLPLSSVFFI